MAKMKLEDVTMDDILTGKTLDVEAVTAAPAAPGGGDVAPAAPAKDVEPAAVVEPKASAVAAAPAKVEPEADEVEADEDAGWINSIPESHRERVQRMSKSLKGQGHALARKTQQLEAAETERRQAVQVALQSRSELADFQQRHLKPAEPAVPAKPAIADDFIDAELDADGRTVKIPASVLDERIARARQPERDQEQAAQQSQARMQAAGSYANQLLAEAAVPMETQNRLLGAFREMSQMFVDSVRRTGARPASNAEERKFMRDAGIEGELQKKYPGVSLEDLYDVYESVQDPWNQGHRLVRIGKDYAQKWSEGAGAPAGRAPQKPRVPEHPGSLGRKGSGDTHVETTLDDIMGVKLEDVANGRFTKKQMDELTSRWKKEVGAGP